MSSLPLALEVALRVLHEALEKPEPFIDEKLRIAIGELNAHAVRQMQGKPWPVPAFQQGLSDFTKEEVMQHLGVPCYHCGATGRPLVEWQPNPPRPDIKGPFPMVCADGCVNDPA